MDNHITVDNAVKIRCQFCDIADSCKKRESKEKYEKAGWVTRCSLTPNRPGSNRKKRKKQKKA